MTREEILAMEPGRELDALVAEKVMGWKECGVEGLRAKIAYGKPSDFDDSEPRVRIEEYSSDISAAWEVVERFHPYTKLEANQSGGWIASIKGHSVHSDTVPDAICIAALLAVMDA